MEAPQPDNLEAVILAYETRVWQALASGDAGADAALLATHFLGVYPDGFGGKSDHSGQLSGGPTIGRFALSDVRLMQLGSKHALIAYRADFRRVNARDDEAMFVSSIWERSGAGWVNIFSQDTPVC